MRLVALLAVCLGCAVAVSGVRCGRAGLRPCPLLGAASAATSGGGGNVLRGVYSRLNGARDDIGRYRGRVVLVVNTATACGFTPQFDGLEKLYRRLERQGPRPARLPGQRLRARSRAPTRASPSFCKNNYGVSFPMFAKTTSSARTATRCTTR